MKFFNDRNPDWLKGHQLIGVAKVTWTSIFRIVIYSLKRLRRGKNMKSKKASKKSVLKRVLSFQSEEAQAYVRKHSTELLSIQEESKRLENSKPRKDSLLGIDFL